MIRAGTLKPVTSHRTGGKAKSHCNTPLLPAPDPGSVPRRDPEPGPEPGPVPELVPVPSAARIEAVDGFEREDVASDLGSVPRLRRGLESGREFELDDDIGVLSAFERGILSPDWLTAYKAFTFFFRSYVWMNLTRYLIALLCCLEIAALPGPTAVAAPKKAAVKPVFDSAPSFNPPAEKWSRFDSTETLGQPVTFWEFKERRDFRVIHYMTWQTKEATDTWEGLLKKTCSILLPQLSAALSTNVQPPKDLNIGSVPGCVLRIQSKDKSITEHYIFIWNTSKERAKDIYQGHTVTVNYPANYLAQGHEALEKFLASIKLPEATQ